MKIQLIKKVKKYIIYVKNNINKSMLFIICKTQKYKITLQKKRICIQNRCIKTWI